MANTYHGLTRSQIMRRAWQLAHLNNPTSKARARQSLGRWQATAWDQAQRGDTENWTFLSAAHEARAVEHQLTALEWGNGSDRYMPDHIAAKHTLRARLNVLRTGGSL